MKLNQKFLEEVVKQFGHAVLVYGEAEASAAKEAMSEARETIESINRQNQSMEAALNAAAALEKELRTSIGNLTENVLTAEKAAAEVRSDLLKSYR